MFRARRQDCIKDQVRCLVLLAPIDLDHMSVCMGPRGNDKGKQNQLFDAILKRSRLLPPKSASRSRQPAHRESVVRDFII